jgi:hypothetical protein
MILPTAVGSIDKARLGPRMEPASIGTMAAGTGKGLPDNLLKEDTSPCDICSVG